MVLKMCLLSVKKKLIFLIGFLIGFTLAVLLFISNDDNYSLSLMNKKKLMSLNSSQDFDNTYKNFLNYQNVKVKNIDMDIKQYGLQLESDSITMESDWLKSKIHITCIVLVEKIKFAQTISDTWGPRCNKIYFFSRNFENLTIPIIKISNITSSWQMLCEIIQIIWNDHKFNLEWIIFVKDDTIVIPENLRHLVAHLDYNKNYYLGHPVTYWGQAYNVAEAGYVLSKGSLSKIIEKFDKNEKCILGGKYWKKEDYDLGKNLATLNIYPLDMRDNKKRGTFHGYSLQTLLFGLAKPGNYFTKALYPPGTNCCSPKSVTFSVSESDKVYTLNYILYHLNVFKQNGQNGNKPASTPVPEDEVIIIFFLF